ncbi:hypothetical protein L3i23_23240 [Herbiconiux sp. L3-i23]|nr:hypothetical protein L3i23_23240 [Herbiconiux sp. L3-i23]
MSLAPIFECTAFVVKRPADDVQLLAMTSDKDIGARVAGTRGGMSQRLLATRMRDLGWPWSQATVSSVEKGERPLRLAEAEALAGLFDVPVASFLPGWGKLLRQSIDELEEATASARTAWEKVRTATANGSDVSAEIFDLHVAAMTRVDTARAEVSRLQNEYRPGSSASEPDPHTPLSWIGVPRDPDRG